MKYEDCEEAHIFGSNKWQEIKHTIKKPYVRYRNQRLYLDDFAPLIYPEIEKEIGYKIHGFYGIGWFEFYMVHFDPDEKMAKVYHGYCSKRKEVK